MQRGTSYVPFWHRVCVPLTLLNTTHRINELIESYGVNFVVKSVHHSAIELAVAANPPNMFGFAMAHGFADTARKALPHFQRYFRVHANEQRAGISVGPQILQPRDVVFGDTPYLLTDVPAADLARLTLKTSLELQAAQERVLLGKSTWADEAKTIKVRLGCRPTSSGLVFLRFSLTRPALSSFGQLTRGQPRSK